MEADYLNEVIVTGFPLIEEPCFGEELQKF